MVGRSSVRLHWKYWTRPMGAVSERWTDAPLRATQSPNKTSMTATAL